MQVAINCEHKGMADPQTPKRPQMGEMGFGEQAQVDPQTPKPSRRGLGLGVRVGGWGYLVAKNCEQKRRAQP